MLILRIQFKALNVDLTTSEVSFYFISDIATRKFDNLSNDPCFV
jgi:hypothetical protein